MTFRVYRQWPAPGRRSRIRRFQGPEPTPPESSGRPKGGGGLRWAETYLIGRKGASYDSRTKKKRALYEAKSDII